MSDNLTIALLQYDIEWLQVKRNLSKLQNLFRSVTDEVDLILLPEMFATGFTVSPEELIIENQYFVVKWLQEYAAKYNTVIAGSYPYFENDKLFNRLLFVRPDSKIEHYNKRHLFSISDEHLNYQPGTERKIFELKGWKIMPQICYDLRFPVWSRNTMNYDLLVYSSNWPAIRNLAWESLLKARAIENQSYVVGINRIGVDGNNISYIGNSQVISSKGDIIANLGNEEKLCIVTLDKKEMINFRRSFPALNDADTFKLEDLL